MPQGAEGRQRIRANGAAKPTRPVLDIVEAILGGWADQRVMLERLERPLPMGGQRERIIS